MSTSERAQVPAEILEPVRSVVLALRDAVEELDPTGLMLIGAVARDVLHAAEGHTFITAATHDLDLALCLEDWRTFDAIRASFPSAGETGIRLRIAGHVVDVIPFGVVEDPEGVVHLPGRADGLGVWALEEVFRSSDVVGGEDWSVRMPTVSGYAAAKVGAWLDRVAWHETKDASDLALSTFWYAESATVQDRLYDLDHDARVLVAEEVDVTRAAAHLLGRDIASTVGKVRVHEIRERWSASLEQLTDSFRLTGRHTWLADQSRRSEVVKAFGRGLLSEEVRPG